MLRLKTLGSILRTTGLAALLGGTLLTLTACETFPSQGNGIVARDILEIKQKLDQNIDQQAASKRTSEYAISQLNENLQKYGDAQQGALDEMQKKLQDQAAEIQNLRNEVQALSFKSGGPASQPGTGTLPPAGTPPTTAGTTPSPSNPQPITGPSAASQAYANAIKAYNGGNFAAAREGFRQALEQNPSADLKIEILFGLAESCYMQKDYKGAEENYKALIYARGNHPRAWASLERLADIDAASGKKKDALDKLNQIVKVNPSYANISRVKATIARLSGGGAAAAPEQGGLEPEPMQ